ncbi:MAG: reverse transcriptase-like protein [Actinobacteria bacterium]|nr:reverse transcriptase-like protein [Actinomycetota bacterium]MSV94262.1 reverse transcriptase-like protein [Actinomycetota bacterium]MSW61437.1 reverse transcriptase-like protein [Actinomycetota bacterium]MSY45031.1 reverse transcriptase-like protein [Actinomycetota bacterium]
MSEMREVVELYADGGARGNPGPAGIGAVVYDPSTSPPQVLASVSETIGVATNNVAEYRAMIAGLEIAANFPAQLLRVRSDSLLVIRQLQGVWKVKQVHLKPLHAQALALLRNTHAFDLDHVPREQNTEADFLVNAALDAQVEHER